MITTPTVLILGAGASKPFGFPIGKELKESICKKLSNRSSREHKQLVSMPFRSNHILEFVTSLRFSAASSVDAFLEHRSEFTKVGKTAIAQALLPFEKTNALFSFEINNWYEYLFRKLDALYEDFSANEVSFITFNYDRSLEQFLYTALLHKYGKVKRKKDRKECLEVLNKIPIVHLYGKLGNLPFNSKKGIPYDLTKPTRPIIKKAAREIKIISEDVEEDPEFAEAHELLINADYVYFVGFGYNKTNLDRLRLGHISKDLHKSLIIRGTGVGLSSQEIKNVKEYFTQRNFQIDIKNQKAYTFIRNVSL